MPTYSFIYSTDIKSTSTIYQALFKTSDEECCPQGVCIVQRNIIFEKCKSIPNNYKVKPFDKSGEENKQAGKGFLKRVSGKLPLGDNMQKKRLAKVNSFTIHTH